MTIAAEAVGDSETASLAKQIQAQEKQTAEKVWKLIAPTASRAYTEVSASGKESGQEVILRYIQDAEAAERNFEDALATFSNEVTKVRYSPCSP